MSTPNHNYVTPEHGEVCGAGICDKGRFVMVYDAVAKRVRTFWNHDTPESDAKHAADMQKVQKQIGKGAFWKGQ